MSSPKITKYFLISFLQGLKYFYYVGPLPNPNVRVAQKELVRTAFLSQHVRNQKFLFLIETLEGRLKGQVSQKGKRCDIKYGQSFDYDYKVLSSSAFVLCGVPKGSPLGPILFPQNMLLLGSHKFCRISVLIL